jgi:uncharacterized protein
MIHNFSETRHLIPAPQGQLELIVAEANQSQVTAIMCHPHSQMGGTMHNKVVTTTIRAWQKLGYHTIRFNFRGVLASTGVFDHGVGEQQDLGCVIEWARTHLKTQQLILGGFSFGAFVTLQFCQTTTPDLLLLIAPPTHYPNFYNLHTPTHSTNILVVAESDEVVSSTDIVHWADTQHFEKIFVIPEASHFFHGKLTILREFIELLTLPQPIK